jgi:hypothetical protein
MTHRSRSCCQGTDVTGAGSTFIKFAERHISLCFILLVAILPAGRFILPRMKNHFARNINPVI